MTSTVVVCEGFHDRAFIKGWLKARDWNDDKPTKTGRGEFAFQRSGESLRLKPVSGGGTARVLSVSRELWDARTLDAPIDRLVVSVDSDEPIDSADPQKAVRQAYDARFAGESAVSLLCWHVPGATAVPGLPSKHTLELLVCEAMRRVYPGRLAAVATFLDAQPQAADGSDGRVKEHAWAYMAKWYGEAGCDEFYQSIWRDPALRPALEDILSHLGTAAW